MRVLVSMTAIVFALGFALLPMRGASGRHLRRDAQGSTTLLLTQVPGSEVSSPTGTPDERYPDGSRVVLVRVDAPDDGLVLSRGLVAAGAPDLSPAADRAVFVGRECAGERWRVFETALHGGAPRAIAAADGDCADPAYLSPGYVVFAVHPDGDASRSYLAVADGEGVVERITFGPGAVATPTGLADGRVLFSMATERGETALFTVNADGTLLEPFTDSHQVARHERRARATHEGGVVLLAEAAGTLALERVATARPAAGASAPFAGSEALGGLLRDPLSAEPTADGGLVLCGAAGVARLEPGGAPARVLLDAPEWRERDAILVEPSPRARLRPSAVNPALETAILICYDAGLGDGRVGPSASAAEPTSVMLETLADGRLRELGSAPLEADRSLHLEVPADAALRLRTLDAERRELATSGWFWLRPGEVRTCFGCHEPRDSAPANRSVLAVSAEPRCLPPTERSAAR